MANNIAFQPMGKTVSVSVSGAANTESSIITVKADSPVNQYSLSNEGNATVYVGISATTPFNVALPGTASGYVIPVLANSTRIITTIQTGFNNVYAKIIGYGTNASCYITPGEGI